MFTSSIKLPTTTFLVVCLQQQNKKCDSPAELLFCAFLTITFFWRSRCLPSLSWWLYLPTILIKPLLFIRWYTYLVDMLCNAYILYLVVFLMKQTLLLDIFRTVALHSWHCQTKSPLQTRKTLLITADYSICKRLYFLRCINRKSQIYEFILICTFGWDLSKH